MEDEGATGKACHLQLTREEGVERRSHIDLY